MHTDKRRIDRRFKDSTIVTAPRCESEWYRWPWITILTSMMGTLQINRLRMAMYLDSHMISMDWNFQQPTSRWKLMEHPTLWAWSRRRRNRWKSKFQQKQVTPTPMIYQVEPIAKQTTSRWTILLQSVWRGSKSCHPSARRCIRDSLVCKIRFAVSTIKTAWNPELLYISI